MTTIRARLTLAEALALTLLGVACAPVTSWTGAEAPKRLGLDTATTQIDLRFAPGSAALSPAEAAHLRRLAANGGIAASDRVTIAASGDSRLAQQRVAAVSALLLNYGIVPVAGALVDVPRDHALVAVNRTLVTLPACPNWSKPSSSDFGNQPSSNFGCANEVNLGMMIANPSDLASGLRVGPAAGHPAAAAVNRYLNDKVELPTANTALPVAAPSSAPPSGGANPTSPSGTGSGTGS